MTDTQIQQIEDYLSKRMNAEQQRNFEQEMAADSKLAAACDTYRTVETDIFNSNRYSSENDLKTTLSKLRSEFFHTSHGNNKIIPLKEQFKIEEAISTSITAKKKPRSKNIQVWKLVATVIFGILVLGTGYVFMRKKNEKGQVVFIPATSYDSTRSDKNSRDTAVKLKPGLPQLVLQEDTGNAIGPGKLKTPEQKRLFAKYFTPDAAPKDQEGPLEDAFYQYEKGQFANAATEFERADLNALTRSEATDTLLTKFYASYYKALSYIAIKKDAKAIHILKNLIGSDPYLQVKVQWYLALAYLRTGDLPKARLLLRAIGENREAGAYRLKADKVIIELRK